MNQVEIHLQFPYQSRYLPCPTIGVPISSIELKQTNSRLPSEFRIVLGNYFTCRSQNQILSVQDCLQYDNIAKIIHACSDGENMQPNTWSMYRFDNPMIELTHETDEIVLCYRW